MRQGIIMTYSKALRLESLEKTTINLSEVSWPKYRFGLPLGDNSVRNVVTIYKHIQQATVYDYTYRAMCTYYVFMMPY
jgi:hypothetical protein